jgi:glycosyltransferase involved in cell wall biosynthesis
MRIGVDIRELQQGRRTGIGRYLRNLIEYTARRRPEHELLLYGNQHTDAAGLSQHGRVRCAHEVMTLWFDQVQLPAMARADGAEIFLSPYIKGPTRVTCPLAVTIHDLMDLAWPQYGAGWRRLRNEMMRLRAAHVGRRADIVFTDSKHSAADIQRFLGLPRDKVQILPIGVDASYTPMDAAAASACVQTVYQLGGAYLLYVGNFKPHKNVDMLVRAYASLPADLRDLYQLVLAGRTDQWVARLKELAAQLGVEERVRFTGAVAEEHMAALLSAATLFVFPSLYEGFGLPPLEAMACGTPVVASNLTSVPEVVGDAGILVDPRSVEALGQAMERGLTDEDERQRLRQAGLARAAQLGSEQICSRQLEILEGVACRRTRAR